MSRLARCAVVAMAHIVLCGMAHADQSAPPQIEFRLESQPLSDAVTAWAQQAGLQFIWSTGGAETTTRVAPRVMGRFAPFQALHLLLEGSGLTYSFVDKQTVAIHSSPSTTGQAQSVLPATVRLAESGTVAEDPTARAPLADVRRDQKEIAPEVRTQQVDTLQEIVVTGTHIRGVKDVAASSVVITRKDIDESGVTRVENLFETLPQNFSGVSFDGVAAANSSELAGGNLQGVTGIDLRGLGPQSTLVLVNGQRRAGGLQGRVVDVSTIPLPLIDQVDVLTGGHSAIYGSDAVAGVVNITLRRSFDGAETRLQYGDTAHAGGDDLQLSQVFGREFSRGGFVVAYDYSRSRALDLLDTHLVVSPSVAAITPTRIDLAPDRTQHSFYAAGRFEVGNSVEFFADVQYVSDKNEAVRNFAIADVFTADTFNKNEGNEYNGSAGTRIGLSQEWELKIEASRSRAVNDRTNIDVFGGFGGPSAFNEDAALTSISAIANGTIPLVGYVEPRIAVGIEARKEVLHFSLDGTVLSDNDRTVRSGFLEAVIPLVNNTEKPWLHRLDISLAGRIDDYSDFGDTFNPEYGLVWSPLRGLTFRGTYSTAYRAPSLYDLRKSNFVFLANVTDPSPDGTVIPALVQGGTIPVLGPEKATTWSAGLEFSPNAFPGTHVNASYFRVKYRNRIDVPISVSTDQDLLLVRSDRYGGLIDRTPTPQELEAIVSSDDDGVIENGIGTPFDPATDQLSDVFPGLVLFDNRRSNIAVESVSGVDVGLTVESETQFGRLAFGFNGTYTLDHERSVTSRSPAFSLVDDVGHPPDFRFRANSGLTKGAYTAFLSVNYTDGYPNLLSSTGSSIGSWTTFDLTLSYLNAAKIASGPLSGLGISLGVVNLFDRRPPEFLESTLGLRYDAANANPLGRYISITARKKW